MQKSISVVSVLLIMTSSLSCASHLRKPAGDEAQQVYVVVENPNQTWRENEGDATTKKSDEKFIRGNPWHFWAWARLHAQDNLSKKLLSFSGVVTADPHYYNFADLHGLAGESDFALVDVDDSGRAPLLLDLIRFLAFLRAAESSIDETAVNKLAAEKPAVNKLAGNEAERQASLESSALIEVLGAYEEGLDGQSLPMPGALSRALSFSRDEFLKWQRSRNGKKISGQKFILREGDLQSLESRPVEDQQLAGEISDFLLHNTEGEQILDAAIKIDDGGSSKGLRRFWYLIKVRGELEIIEFKELKAPGSAYYQAQASNETRLKEVMAKYIGEKDFGLGVTKLRGVDFWYRYKSNSVFDSDAVDHLSVEDKRIYALAIANWLGFKCRAEMPEPLRMDYLAALRDKTGETSVAIERTVSGYLDYLHQR